MLAHAVPLRSRRAARAASGITTAIQPPLTCSVNPFRPRLRPGTLISTVGLEPAYAGDEDATGTVDALLPLWFAMVKLNGGNRKVSLRIIR